MNTALLRAGLDRVADPDVHWDQRTFRHCFAAQICRAAGWTLRNDNGIYDNYFISPDGVLEMPAYEAANLLLTGDVWDERYYVAHGVRRTFEDGTSCALRMFSGTVTLPELIRMVNALDPEGAKALQVRQSLAVAA